MKYILYTQLNFIYNFIITLYTVAPKCFTHRGKKERRQKHIRGKEKSKNKTREFNNSLNNTALKHTVISLYSKCPLVHSAAAVLSIKLN